MLGFCNVVVVIIIRILVLISSIFLNWAIPCLVDNVANFKKDIYSAVSPHKSMAAHFDTCNTQSVEPIQNIKSKSNPAHRCTPRSSIKALRLSCFIDQISPLCHSRNADIASTCFRYYKKLAHLCHHVIRHTVMQPCAPTLPEEQGESKTNFHPR